MSRRKELDETEMRREIERIDQGDDAWNETDAVVQVEGKRPLNMVIPVRLSSDKWEQVRAEAN